MMSASPPDPDLTSPSHATVRPRSHHKWKTTVVKKCNKGQEYVSRKSGKLVAARQPGPPCTCRQNCYDKIGRDNLIEIFENYWAAGDWNLQTAYLQKQTSVCGIKGKQKGSPNKQRTCARLYFLTVHGEPIQVCKQAFVSVHGISRGRLDGVSKKMLSTGMPLPDLRGKHDANDVNYLIGDVIEMLHY